MSSFKLWTIAAGTEELNQQSSEITELKNELLSQKRIIERLIKSSMPMDRVNELKFMIKQDYPKRVLKTFEYDPVTEALHPTFENVSDIVKSKK